MTRTFIALEMNEAQQSYLAGVIHQVARVLPSVRWVDPSGIHLTLAFLDELTDEQLEEAMQAAESAVQHARAFSYRLSHLGVFGSPRQPRVIWMGVEEPDGNLLHLHRVLNRALKQRGFEIERRPFSPHLTLARIKSPLPPDEQQRLQSLINGKQHGIVSSEVYPAQHLNVMKSELLRTGARYTCLRSYTLQ
jgi:RNA 2',3'-cyclic 3'-phosphodiesterase